MCLMHSLSKKVLATGLHTVAWGSHEIPSWHLEVRWVYFLFLINVRIQNERVGWVGGRMGGSEIIYLPVQMQEPRPREGRDLPKVTQQNGDFLLWKGESNVRSFILFLFPSMKDLGGWGDHLARRPSSLGDMTVECVGETRRLLFQAQQANRPMCGQKGLWLSAARLCFVWSVNSSSKVPQTCEAW